jgi:threonine dehydratase
MAPERIVMGLGTGLPLRLKQMGIPYEPAAAVQAADRLRGKKVAIVVSGGNITIDHLRRVLLDSGT